MSKEEKIKEIENEIARTQKNKATAFHLGLLKARLSRLRKESTAGTKSQSADGFDVSRTGIARVGLIGFPSVGKSSLLSQLTSTISKAAQHEFTTITAIPGVLNFKGAKIQLVDLPGIVEGATTDRGRGRRVLAVARGCHALLVVLSASAPLFHKVCVDRELMKCGIRINTSKPPIVVEKSKNGLISVCGDGGPPETAVRAILSEMRVSGVCITFQGQCSLDDVVDSLSERVYMPVIYAINKADCVSWDELSILARVPYSVPISACKKWNLDGLCEEIWKRLNIIRIFAKPKGKPVDYEEPVILREKRTILDFCNSIHKSIVPRFKHALVWGTSAKHNPQKVGLSHILHDGDVVQLAKRV